MHLKISARAESYTRSACRQPSFGAKEERFAASQSHFAYRLVFLGGYRIRSVPKIKDFDRAAKTVGVSIPPHPQTTAQAPQGFEILSVCTAVSAAAADAAQYSASAAAKIGR